MAAATNTADLWPLCEACAEFPIPRHDECEGAVVWCECMAEVLIEAEEKA